MHRSTNRILTTHTGSLPRTAKVVELLLAEDKNPGARRAELRAAVAEAVKYVVGKQIECGLDIINDGEQGRTDYTVHVLNRLTGYEGESAPPMGTGEPEFPELARNPQAVRLAVPAPPGLQRPGRLEGLGGGGSRHQDRQGGGGRRQMRGHLHDLALARADRALPQEQILQDRRGIHLRARRRDAEANTRRSSRPASCCSSTAPISPCCATWSISTCRLADYRKIISVNVAALNHAVRDLPPERMRMHVCWGSTVAPHHTDVEIKDIIDIVLTGRPHAVSFPAANPRHEHEWKVWRDVKLPAGKIIIPGVIDSTSNFVEHPELVADRIANFASVVGRENVIAGVDCGFGTFAGRVQVDSKIVWMKLASLAEGARRASKQLWEKAA